MYFFQFSLPYINIKSIILIVLLFTIGTYNLFAQKKDNKDYSQVPKALTRKVKRLTKKDTTQEDKFLHIASWIIKKKSYDIKGFEEIRLKNYPLQQLWRNKRLLCREYTRLLEAMCKEAGINCFNVEGYMKASHYYPYKKFYHQTHEWNVVQLDGHYQIADITWASGYVVPKISLWGRVRILLKQPYIPRRWKFVKKPNLYYLNIPPEELLKTHMPVLPMWQLNTHPVSIKRFETETFPVTDTTTVSYPFKQRIQSYNSQTEMDRLLVEAEDGYTFNPKNNYNKGACYLRYAYMYWEKFHKETLSPKEKLNRSENLKKYAQESEQSLRRFLQDNRNIMQHLRDSLRIKNREVNSFIGKYATLTKRKANEVDMRIRTNNQKNKMAEITIANRINERNRYKDTWSNHRTARSRKPPKDLKILESIKESLNNNEIQVANLIKSLPSLDSAFITLEQSHPIHDPILYYERIKNNLIKYAIALDIFTNNKYYLRDIHHITDSVQTIINSFEKELSKNERKDYLKLIRYRDSICMRAIKLIVKNKGLIVQLYRLSIEDNNEEKLYRKQNERLDFWFNELIRTQKFLNETGNKTNYFYNTRESILRHTQKELRRYSKYEKYIYHRHMDAGYYRYKKYESAGKSGISNSILLRRKAIVIINDSKKQLNKK